MKKLTIISVLLLTFFTCRIISFAQTSTQFPQGPPVVENNLFTNNFYITANDTVTISETITADVYVAGGQVIVSGTINGDLIAVGGTVLVSGTIRDDLVIIGGQVTVTGDIGDNLTVAAGNLELTPEATVSGGILAAAGNINVLAPIGGDLIVASESLLVDNQIGGRVEALVSNLTLASNTRVNRDLAYNQDARVSISEDAQISGETIQRESRFKLDGDNGRIRREAPRVLGNIFFGASLADFISSLIIGLLLLRYLPGLVDKSSYLIARQPFKSLGVGFLTLLLAPVLLFVLFVLALTIPLALILFTLFLITLFVAKIFPAVWFGTWLSQKLNLNISSFWTFIIGLILLYIILFIPVLGVIIWFFVLLFGLGSFLLSLFSASPKES
ncbi:MAG: hypothetical protein ACOX6N_03120 [Patescibacteria group bacterium]|jgi:cytoskeletal protein CcmA (bactofilin family)